MGVCVAQILLDFGLAEELTPRVRRHFISFLHAISKGDAAAGARHMLQFGAVQVRSAARLCFLWAHLRTYFAVIWLLSLRIPHVTWGSGRKVANAKEPVTAGNG